MTQLSVNINKIATLRNARGGNNPDVIKTALLCEKWGAQGITVHPRPDERHIRFQDVLDLKPRLTTEFNIEGYPSPEFISLVLRVQPAQVTLVPDAPGQLTSNHGWNVRENKSFLTDVIASFKEAGIRTSIFIDAIPETACDAANTGTDRVELYTEPYAVDYPKDRTMAVQPFVQTAQAAIASGLGVNAGHDLSLENLAFFHQNVKGLSEVSIGHALVCDALFFGLEETIQRYLACLQ